MRILQKNNTPEHAPQRALSAIVRIPRRHRATRDTTQKTPNGFTLIEVAMALIILGLIMAPLLYSYSTNYERKKIAETRGNFHLISRAIERFYLENNRYPLPASITAAPNTANYGREFSVGTLPTGCPNINTDGLCVAESGADAVLIGAVPFSELKIPSEKALDAWGNRIIYAVTATQTDSATYTRLNNGRIQFQALHATTGQPIPLIPENGSNGYTNFDLVLVSTGATGKGGYNADGNLIGTCVEPGNPEFEDINCSFTNTFLIDQNKRRDITDGSYDFRPDDRTGLAIENYAFFSSVDLANGTRSLLPGPAFYDDMTHEIRHMEVNLSWDHNLVDPGYVVTEANRLAIGHNNPSVALDVRGDIMIAPKPNPADPTNPNADLTPGRLITPEICGGGADCMRPELLAGTQTNMHCFQRAGSGQQPVLGIGNSRVFCGTAASNNGTPLPSVPQPAHDGSNFDAPVTIPSYALSRVRCPEGQLMQGFSGGTPICITPY